MVWVLWLFGRLTRRAADGSGTQNAANVVAQYTAVPLQKWQIRNRMVVFQTVHIKTCLFQQGFDMSMFRTQYQLTKTCFVGDCGENLIQTVT